jgi:uncharacterized protein YjbI with pentapeptide repeats
MPDRKKKIDFIKHFMMIGHDLEQADLSGMDLSGACLANSNLRSAKCIETNFTGADLRKADLSGAVLRLANFTDADLSGADMSMSYAKAALFLRTRMWNTIVRHGIWKNALIIDADCTGMDVVGSLLMGARWDGTKTLDMRNTDKAFYQWWMSPWGGPPSYDPIPGWTLLDESVAGGMSFRENAAREQIEKE